MITGGARRVGRAVALELARRGCALLLSYRDSRDECLQTAQDARQLGSPLVEVHALELCDAESIAAFAQFALSSAEVDGVVHSASSFESQPIGAVTASGASRQFASDAIGPLLLSQALAASLRGASTRGSMASGAGIVLFGDAHASRVPRRGYTAYLMAKAAAHALVRQLAVELAPTVRVNGIAPGVILWPESMSPAAREAYLAQVPLKRAGTPEEAAKLAAFLLLDANYCTGQILQLDGGRNL